MLKKNFIFLFYFVFTVYFFCFVNASLVTNINTPDSYVLGEKMFFNYSLVSNINTSIEFIPYIECPDAPAAPELEKTVTLTKDIIHENVYYGLVVKDWFKPQTCTAYIRFVKPIQPIVRTTFKIITDPSLEFNIILDKKVFILNEDINIDFTSSVGEPLIKAILTLPDSSTKSLTLPTSIKAEQIGTYELEVTASKQDYKTQTKKEQFAVIEKPAEIETVSVCNADGVCSGEENAQNCPQDCKGEEGEIIGKKITKGPIFYTMIISIVLVIAIITLYVIYYFKRKRESHYL